MVGEQPALIGLSTASHLGALLMSIVACGAPVVGVLLVIAMGTCFCGGALHEAARRRRQGRRRRDPTSLWGCVLR